MKKTVKKTTAKAIKKATFAASPVSRKKVEAIKSKLRKAADQKDAVKIAKTELAAEKRELSRKAHLKLMDDLYKKSKKGKK
jgi:hypothetical protein